MALLLCLLTGALAQDATAVPTAHPVELIAPDGGVVVPDGLDDGGGFFEDLGSDIDSAVDDATEIVDDAIKAVTRTMQEWSNYFEDHLKQYGITFDESDEEEERMMIFMNSVEEIEDLNAREEAAGRPGPVTVNAFATLNVEEVPAGGSAMLEDPTTEFQELKRRRTTTATYDEFGHKAQDPPMEWSWRAHRGGIALRSVKHQTCNNCWVYGSTGAMETRNFLKNCMMADLSVHMGTDCTMEPTRGHVIPNAYGQTRTGCIPGFEWDPMILAITDGILTTADYMSELYDQGTKSLDELYGTVLADEVCRIDVGDEVLTHPGVKTDPNQPMKRVTTFEDLKWELFNEGACTLGLGIDSRLKAWKGTQVFEPALDVNHIVTIVGYGYDSQSRPYVLCKNSWGTSWGDEGFFKVLASEAMWQSGKIRSFCPKVASSGTCHACTDGQKVDASLLTHTVFNPPESARTYSSAKEKSPPGFGFARSVLETAGSWMPDGNDGSQALDPIHSMVIDLGETMFVGGVVTQGSPDSDHWTTYYTIHVSVDGLSYGALYNEDEQYFKGNVDRSTKVTNMWGVPSDKSMLEFRYIKIRPVEWHGDRPALRAAVVVYERSGCFCAGVVCPFGTVCSFQRGCVAPGTAGTPVVNPPLVFPAPAPVMPAPAPVMPAPGSFVPNWFGFTPQWTTPQISWPFHFGGSSSPTPGGSFPSLDNLPEYPGGDAAEPVENTGDEETKKSAWTTIGPVAAFFTLFLCACGLGGLAVYVRNKL